MFMSIILINISLSIMFIIINHPISMGTILLIQTILISISMGNMFMNFWFSYIILLVMVGGLLVLFTYMTSIASNEMFKPNIKLTIIFLPCLMYFPLKNLVLNYKFNNEEFLSFTQEYQFMMLMNKFFNFPSKWIMYLVIIYLLISLIAIVKITAISYGPLRMNN